MTLAPDAPQPTGPEIVFAAGNRMHDLIAPLLNSGANIDQADGEVRVDGRAA